MKSLLTFIQHAILSQSACLKCCPFALTQACSHFCHWPIALSTVVCSNAARISISQITYRFFVHTLLHATPNFLVDRVEVGTVWRPQLWRNESRRIGSTAQHSTAPKSSELVCHLLSVIRQYYQRKIYKWVANFYKGVVLEKYDEVLTDRLNYETGIFSSKLAAPLGHSLHKQQC
jgi:hypothetical protein